MRNITLLLVSGTLAALPCLAEEAESTADSGEIVIGQRAAAVESKWLKPNGTYAAYQAEILDICKLLGGKRTLKAEEESELTAGLRRDPERAGKALVGCLDWAKHADVEIRRGALRALKLAAPKDKSIGAALAGAVMAEPDEAQRKAAVALIKERSDGHASAAMLDHLFKAYDDSGALLNQNLADTAIKALTVVGDKRVYELLLYYVTMEVRAGSSKLVRMDRQFITGGNGQLALPIDLPVLEIISAQGTIVIPARTVLKQITGQDLGRDVNAWKQWIAKQPPFKAE